MPTSAEPPDHEPIDLTSITGREAQILTLLAALRDQREIATTLGVKYPTIRSATE